MVAGRCIKRRTLTLPDGWNQAGGAEDVRPKSVNVGFRFVPRISRIVPDRAEPGAAATLRFRAIDPFHRHADEERDGGKRADRDERDRRRLASRPPDLVRHEDSDSKAKGCPRERQQAVERDLLGGFWNGYGDRHRLPLYVPISKRKREFLADAPSCFCSRFQSHDVERYLRADPRRWERRTF